MTTHKGREGQGQRYAHQRPRIWHVVERRRNREGDAVTAAEILRARLAAAVMAVLAIAPALWITGCEDHCSGSASAPPARVVLAEGRTLRLYGRANEGKKAAKDEKAKAEAIAATDGKEPTDKEKTALMWKHYLSTVGAEKK